MLKKWVFLVILNFKYFNPLSSDKGFLHFHENVSKTYLNLNFLPLFVSKTHFTSFYFTYILKFNSVTNIFDCKQFKLFWGNEELRKSQLRGLKHFVNLTLNFFKFLSSIRQYIKTCQHLIPTFRWQKCVLFIILCNERSSKFSHSLT